MGGDARLLDLTDVFLPFFPTLNYLLFISYLYIFFSFEDCRLWI